MAFNMAFVNNSQSGHTASTSGMIPNFQPSHETAFSEFYDEVKAIEKRDAVLTPKQQIDRLTRPGATYFNLNPYDVLQVEPDAPLSDVKKKYRQPIQMSLQLKLEAVNKAYKTLENEEGLKRCKEVVEEAKIRTEEMIKQKKKQLKKEGKPQDVPEDSVDKYKHAIYVQTCKLFADLERLRQERETKDMHERKRKAEEDALEEERKEMEKEWQKNFEESRTGRVDSWRTWNKKAKKTSKGNLKPPKLKAEKR
ncbi:DnaJ homolog subfamily C member 8-like [Elysia marginata]|uniref:DnaJ homolog subfamily C member 8-like n=1 Tax=Elysia marginata TaxID=1093978 RepID=A0AAV4HMF2_9GAST|nr:DnaJ homolog subfamily C member 8-like [Elysia marginata]